MTRHKTLKEYHTEMSEDTTAKCVYSFETDFCLTHQCSWGWAPCPGGWIPPECVPKQVGSNVSNLL